MNPTLLTDQIPQPDPWATPPDDFCFVLFERIDVEQNEQRYYLVAWQPTLFGWGVVRIWGRKGETQNLRAEPFPSLAEAWPVIRGHIRARLRHGYRIAREGV
jgi:predicted DNA-binding WGR domain protein